MAIGSMDAPIPGENYTSDTKNYPWHRPPQFASMNEAFEYLVEQLAEEDVSSSIITMIEIGVPVSRIVDMIITAGIGGGKFTVDYAILMAGPLSHVICLMARRMDVEADLGVKKKNKMPTKALFDALDRDERMGNAEDAGTAGADIASGLGIAGAPPSAPSEPIPAGPAPSGLMGASPAPAAPGGLAGAPAPAPSVPSPEAPQEEVM